MAIMARVFVFSLVLALGMAMPGTSVRAATSLDEQRQMYTKAMTLLKKGHYRSFRKLKKQLRDYPLYPYLEFEYLRKRMSYSSEKDILAFIDGNQDSPLSYRLRFSWLKHLARKKKWSTFVTNYQAGGGTKLRCQHAQALFKVGKDEQAMEEATALFSMLRPYLK
jgi:soluble lytic murein transglycosylase